MYLNKQNIHIHAIHGVIEKLVTIYMIMQKIQLGLKLIFELALRPEKVSAGHLKNSISSITLQMNLRLLGHCVTTMTTRVLTESNFPAILSI